MISNGPLQLPADPLGGGSRILDEGEAAGAVRQHDWPATVLGPMETWPPELAQAVNFTLSSPLPACTFWGPELIVVHNEPCRRLLGTRAMGKPAQEALGAAWQVAGPILQDAFATGTGVLCERLCLSLETDNGTKDFYLNCSISPVLRSDGVAGLFATMHDVTGAVTILHRLRETEAQSERILNSIGDAVIVTDAAANIARMNLVAESLTGWRSADAIGKPLAEIFKTVDEMKHAPVENPADSIRKRPVAASREHSALLIGRNGAETAIDHRGAPVLDDEGRLTGIVLVFRNIDERRRTQNALLRSEKLAAVGRLASSIAHEINNPLESVMNLIYLARHSEPADAKKYLDLADEEIRRVSIIANQTLRFQKQASNPQAVTAADLFSTVMSIYAGRLKNARVAVERKFRASEPVICFQGDVRQVLNNLVSNALEAMPLGGDF
jgi:PAS domain S-box-containing protein